MKLTAENIKTIEEYVQCCVECGHRAAMLKYDAGSITQVSGFIAVLRDLGVGIPVRKNGTKLSPDDAAQMQAYLAELHSKGI